jgi:hypothetical protein
MLIEYLFRTPHGTARILLRQDRRWEAMFEDEPLGSYATPQQAAEDLAGGHTWTPSAGDTARFGIPSDLKAWTAIGQR